jgi:hypothetical protein
VFQNWEAVNTGKLKTWIPMKQTPETRFIATMVLTMLINSTNLAASIKKVSGTAIIYQSAFHGSAISGGACT